MTVYKIGVSDPLKNRTHYLNRFPCMEVRAGLYNPPTSKRLKKWAEESPQDFEYIWVASQYLTHDARDIRKGKPWTFLPEENPRRAGHFRNSSENHRIWKEVLDKARTLGARHILLETPASLAPSPANKAMMRDFAQWAELRPEERIIWEPSGFWQRDEAIELSRSLGWILGVDPLVDPKEPLPPGPVGYFRLAGHRGWGTPYTLDDLYDLLELTSAYEEVYIIFRTQKAEQSAQKLLSIIAEQGEDFLDDFIESLQ